jgi:hypothetical protein
MPTPGIGRFSCADQPRQPGGHLAKFDLLEALQEGEIHGAEIDERFDPGRVMIPFQTER